MSRFPSIDVITAVGREDKWLTDACKSVADFAKLTGVPVTHFLTSDGPSLEWIKAQAEPHRSKVYEFLVSPFSGRRIGPARSRNAALKRGVSDFVLTLDSDDVFDAEELAELWRALQSSGAPWAAGRMLTIDEDSRIKDNGPTIYMGDGWSARDIFRKHWRQYGYFPFHCTATICERSLLEEAGGWDTSKTFVRGEDIALWVRVTKKVPGWFSHRPVLHHREHSAALSSESIWKPEGWTPGDLFSNEDLLANPEESSGDFESDLQMN